jgi:hypothetical protein
VAPKDTPVAKHTSGGFSSVSKNESVFSSILYAKVILTDSDILSFSSFGVEGTGSWNS